MVQSLELTLDDALDAAVRAEWRTLSDAGLPSQARHTGASNRPHITLAVADELDRLDSTIETEPLNATFPVRLGAYVVFRSRTVTLARLVVPSLHLLSLHDRASSLARVARGYRAHTSPGHWTPHVTVARRLSPAELADAMSCLGDAAPELDGTTAALRRWDGDAKKEWPVGSAQNP